MTRAGTRTVIRGSGALAAVTAAIVLGSVVPAWGGTGGTPQSVTVAPATAVVDVGSQHTVTATVRDESSEPLEGAVVDVQVSGANPGTKCSGVKTDTAGQASCTYTGTEVGTDTITVVASRSGQSATGTATARWQEPPTTTTTSTTTTTTSTTTTSSTTTTTAPRSTTSSAGTTSTDTTAPTVTTTTSVVIEGEDVQAQQPLERTEFAAALPRPGEVNLDLGSVAAVSLVALMIIVLVGFPAEIFNKTWEENSTEIQRMLGRRGHLGDDPVAPPPAREATQGRRALQFGAVAVVSALLYGFLDPGFDLVSRQGASLVVGVLLAIVLVTATFELTQAAFVHRRFGIRGVMSAYPGTILVAVVCVALSRALTFVPGYMYGLVADVRIKGLRDEEEGPSLAVAAVALVTLGALAWVAWLPVDDRMAGGDPGFGLLVLDAMLVAVVVAAIEGLLFGMLPLTFLDGGKVSRWRRGVWVLLEALGAVAMVMIVMHPEAGLADTATDVSVVSMMVLFAAFGLASLAFWGWFRRRLRLEAGEPAIPGGG